MCFTTRTIFLSNKYIPWKNQKCTKLPPLVNKQLFPFFSFEGFPKCQIKSETLTILSTPWWSARQEKYLLYPFFPINLFSTDKLAKHLCWYSKLFIFLQNWNHRSSCTKVFVTRKIVRLTTGTKSFKFLTLLYHLLLLFNIFN